MKHILLVEDDPRDLELTLNVLKKHHFLNRIDVARDGEEALDYLHRRGAFSGRQAQQPVVVLLDIKMPKIDGTEVLRQMKAHDQLKMIPVVMLTSSNENHDLQNCYRLGVNSYIVKPVDIAQFTKSISEVGVFWGLINQPPMCATGKML